MTRTDKPPGTPDTLPDRPGGDARPVKHDRIANAGQGIVRDERGEEQPADKARARLVSRDNPGGNPPGFSPPKHPRRR